MGVILDGAFPYCWWSFHHSSIGFMQLDRSSLMLLPIYYWFYRLIVCIYIYVYTHLYTGEWSKPWYLMNPKITCLNGCSHIWNNKNWSETHILLIEVSLLLATCPHLHHWSTQFHGRPVMHYKSNPCVSPGCQTCNPLTLLKWQSNNQRTDHGPPPAVRKNAMKTRARAIHGFHGSPGRGCGAVNP